MGRRDANARRLGGAFKRHRTPPPDPAPLRASDVRDLYLALLERAPSDEEVAGQLGGCATVGELARQIAESPERRDLERSVRAGGRAFVNTWTPALAPFTHPVGTVSDDGVAQIGREGMLFLIGGSNDLRVQLEGRVPLPPGWEQQWREGYAQREAQVAELGARSVWFVVPDKAIVLADLLPEPLAPARRPVVRLREDLGLDLRYPLEELRATTAPAYLRGDTHLTLEGNHVLATACLEALGAPPPAPLDTVPTTTVLVTGDLGRRFEPAVVDPRAVATEWPVTIVEDNHAEFAALGGHVGTWRVFHNPAASDPRTCLVFGDSYSFGDIGYQGVAWWLALAFRDVHFVWQPFGWDPDYAARIGAELVIFASAERFCLREPPVPVDVRALAAGSLQRLRVGAGLEPTPPEPAPSEPAASERAASEPAPSEPAASEPASSSEPTAQS